MALPSQLSVEVCPNHPDVSSGLVHCARCNRAFCSDCLVVLDGKPYDAVCKEEQLRDIRSGTVSAFQVAGAGRRFVANVLDTLIFMPPYFFAYFYLLLHLRPGDSPGITFLPAVVFSVVWALYEGIMLQRYGGQTLGKKALGIRVVNADGSELEPGQAWKRAISRVLMNLTSVLGIVDALMVFSANRRTLHDRFGKTLVVNWKP